MRLLRDPAVLDREHLLGPRRVAAAYLLALAVADGGRLVTFDRAIPVQAVIGATEAALLRL